jgi:DNA-binding MarR family transcriptional regulator
MNETYILSLIAGIHRHGNRFIENELKNREIKEIATSHGDILFQLYKHESLTMHELSKAIDRDKSTVTVLVNKLVNLGYVKKEKDLKDARIYRLSVTEQGKELRESFEQISKSLLGEIYKNFTNEEKQQIMALLQKIQL